MNSWAKCRYGEDKSLARLRTGQWDRQSCTCNKEDILQCSGEDRGQRGGGRVKAVPW